MYQRILVPIDGSPTADRGVREAMRLAADQKAKVILLHVVDDFPMVAEMSSAMTAQQTDRARGRLGRLREQGEELLAKAKDSFSHASLQADTLLREVTQGRIADVVVEEATKARCDLIVMGTHGRRGFNRLVMGSDAELVVRTSPIPVLLVRQEEPRAA